MPFINAQLDDSVQEGQIVPESEYDLQVVKVSREFSKAAKERGDRDPNMTKVVIRVQDRDYPNAMPIVHYLLDASPDDSDDVKRMRNLDLKRFLTAFGVPFDPKGYDPDDLQGATAKNILVIQEDGDDKITRNKMQLPRLKG